MSLDVTLETLDNPGWSLRVALVGTALGGRAAARKEMESTETELASLLERRNGLRAR